MKLFYAFIAFLIAAITPQYLTAQTTVDLITDGGFSSTSSPRWVAENTNFTIGYGYCSPTAAFGYYATSSTANSVSGRMTQSITVPAQTTNLKFTCKVSISTKEDPALGFGYDSLFIGILDGSSFYGGYLTNLDGTYVTSASSCAPYFDVSFPVPANSSLLNQCTSRNAQFVMVIKTDYTNSTVFRVDDIRVLATYDNNCSIMLGSSGQNVAATGGSGSITINTGGCCSWTGTSSCPSSWVTLSQTSGVGPKTITFNVTPNPTTTPRTCVITIGNQTFTVSQAGATPCAFMLNEQTKTFNASGGSGLFNLTANGSGCPWTITQTNCGFVTLSTATSGSGSGVVNYTVASNTGTARICTLNIGGQNYIISQDGVPQCALTTPIVNILKYDLWVDEQANCTYQWQRNGINISGATSRFYSVTVSGVYTCIVTLNNDSSCKRVSRDVPIVISKTKEVEGFNALKMFPNPSQGQFQVSFELATSRSIRFLCYNSIGQQVYTSHKGRMSGQVDENIVLPQLASGLYMFVIVLDGTEQISQAITIRN